MDEETREEIKNQYSVNELDALYEHNRELIESETDLNETEVFAGSVVSTVRTAGFPLMRGEIARKCGVDRERVKEAVEVVNEESEFVGADRDITHESYREFLLNYINNQRPSENFARMFKNVLEEWEEDESIEKQDEYSEGSIAGAFCWSISHASAIEEDSITLERTADIFHVTVSELINCYRDLFWRHDYGVNEKIVDGHGVAEEIRSIGEKVGIDEDELWTVIGILYDTPEEEYEYLNNKAVAVGFLERYTDRSFEELSVSCNKATAKRISRQVFEAEED